MGDDGFGIHVYKKLQTVDLPERVQFFDAGLSGLKSLELFENCDKVILIDAIENGGEEGEIFRLNFEEISNILENRTDFSSHNLGLWEVLMVLKTSNIVSPLPEIVLFGVEVKKIHTFHTDLSVNLQNSIHQVMQRIQDEIKELADAKV